jgi:hypothetical protein
MSDATDCQEYAEASELAGCWLLFGAKRLRHMIVFTPSEGSGAMTRVMV